MLIYSYTREDAINDGILVEIPNTLFKCPVAATATVFEEFKDRISELILHIYSLASGYRSANRIDFKFDGRQLYSVLTSEGKNEEVVMTILFLGED